ncbi:MAG: hypothetical protein JNK46_08680 [Methylobacteriaceae bacterium]|nr:hypothetical protein [Methylobacteriaceae bacterium]
MNEAADDDAPSRERLIEALRLMLGARRFEEAAAQMFGMGLIEGDLQLSIGQEAVCAGLRLACRPGERMTAGARCLGHAIAAGVAPRALAAELAGRRGGLTDGRGGGRLISPDVGFFGGAPGGTALGEAIGLALAAGVVGAGAAAVFATLDEFDAVRGETLDALRFAQAQRAPVTLCVAEGRVVDGESEAARIADAFGLPAVEVDGQDVAAVAVAAAAARRQALAGGPALIVARTIRFRGHSMADPAGRPGAGALRRPRAGDDPIERLRDRLLELGCADETLEAIEARAEAEADAAFAFAEAAPRAAAEVAA